MNEEPKNILKSFSDKTQVKSKNLTLFISIFVILAGVGSGWLLSKSSFGKSAQDKPQGTTTANVTNTQDEAGISDESTFSNSEAPIGILQEGGINGEGNYHLERPGGPSQNVYLTSTVLDLKSFVGKKVQVWGETLSGQKAGWLMDVGKIKVVK